jgi:hypothetical protein
MMINLEYGGQIQLRRIGATQIAIELKSLDRNSSARTCPKCSAQPGHPCRTKTGRTDGTTHGARWGQVPVEVLSHTDALALIVELQHLTATSSVG